MIKVSKDNNLSVRFPEIAKEWHPTLNGNSKPEGVLPGSGQKVWWKCPKGDDHDYDATIHNRTYNGSGCPKCTNQTSEPELRILTELQFIFDGVIHRHKIEGHEVDIYLPEINLAIEYDGSYFHRDKEDRDRKNNCFFKSKNIQLMRVRHFPLKKLSEQDLVVKNETLTKSDLNLIVANISTFIPKNTVKKLDAYKNSATFYNDEIFKKYLSYFPNPFPEDSLGTKNPRIAKEWHPTENHPLTPENFTPGSNEKVSWKCSKGDDHVWEAAIVDRTSGHGCPYCSGNKVGKDNNLLFLFPEIAKEWHPTLNGNSKPEGVTNGSSAIVWWKCPNGDDHVWEAAIGNRRRGDGCPYCGGKKAGKDNNLLFKRPDIAKQWHPTKNGNLTPENFTPGSNENVWWTCPKGDDHDYDATIVHRTNGSGCPYCANQKVSKDNNLFVLFPNIAKEWHPTKNGDFKPENFTPGSSRIKIWWKCPKGEDHEWDAVIASRSRGSGCPYCSNRKVGKDNNLSAKFPEIAKEWHQTKNGDSTPEKVTPGSKQKVWWKCSKEDDHEWPAVIDDRTRGSGCPECYKESRRKRK